MDKQPMTQQPEFPNFLVDDVDKFFLRAKADLVIQPSETVGIWGHDEPSKVYKHFERVRATPTVIRKSDRGSCPDLDFYNGPLWEPQIPAGRKFHYAYCQNGLDDVHPHAIMSILKTMRAHTMYMLWFSLDVEKYDPSYWAHTFARLFPRFSLSIEGQNTIVVAHVEGRWT